MVTSVHQQQILKSAAAQTWYHGINSQPLIPKEMDELWLPPFHLAKMYAELLVEAVEEEGDVVLGARDGRGGE
jgi:hypothetical protein